MTPEPAIATEMFTVAVLAMALFLLVWCLQALASFRHTHLARYSAVYGSFRLEREARGQRLLRNWLTPAQLRCYEEHAYFEVVGSHSGRTYRIHHGTQANVEQLDVEGRTACAWCFVPEGDLVAGDVMLAQKIAIETNEKAALAVAIRYATLRHLPSALRGRPPALFGTGIGPVSN
jgi:hypothetical protein